MARMGSFKLLQAITGEDKGVSFVPIKTTRPLNSTSDTLAYLRTAEGLSGTVLIVDLKEKVELDRVTITKNVLKLSGKAEPKPKASRKKKAAPAPASTPADTPPATATESPVVTGDESGL